MEAAQARTTESQCEGLTRRHNLIMTYLKLVSGEKGGKT